MDWNSLISALVGGFIATIPTIINNRFQSNERDKDREEKRREAKMQTVEKSIGGDIDKVLDFLASLIKVLSEHGNYEYKTYVREKLRERGVISEDEYKREVNLQVESIVAQTQEAITLMDSIGGLVYSFDDEISSKYDALLNSILAYIRIKQPDSKEASNKPDDVIKKAGGLQRILREKKISILDFEE